MKEYLTSVDSTNEYLKRISGELNNGDFVYTMNQTKGKGRRGRSWESASKGLALSVFAVKTYDATLITTALSVAAAEILKEKYRLAVGIKWPNDIIAENRKLAGILAEATENGYIAGIGINVFNEAEDFSALPFATSLKLLGINEADIHSLAEQTANRFISLLCDKKSLINEFRRLSVTIGKEIKVITPNEEYKAVALGIGDKGELTVNKDGKIINLISGEVSIRGLLGYTE